MASIKKKIKNKKESLELQLEVFIIIEGDYFIAYCPSLDLTSYANDKDSVKKTFEENLMIFLDETQKKGTLEKLLLKLGWTLRQVPEIRYEPPRIESSFLQRSIHNITEVIPEKVSIPI